MKLQQIQTKYKINTQSFQYLVDLSIEEDDEGVDVLDLLLQLLHQLRHRLAVALHVVSQAWLCQLFFADLFESGQLVGPKKNFFCLPNL